MECQIKDEWATFDRPTVVHQFFHGQQTNPLDLPMHKQVRIDLTPLDDHDVPKKLRNDSLIRPATIDLNLSEAIRLLKTPHNERKFHAYVRYFPLDELPETRDSVPRPRGLKIEQANLWLGDGAMTSDVHYDGFDNLLIQVGGRKEVLLWDPFDGRLLDYRTFHERQYAFDRSTNNFLGHYATGRFVENHAAHKAFAHGEPKPTMRCTVAPGDALFIPALWSHAVRSFVDIGQLNVAVNYWFTSDTSSHERALAKRPKWAQGHFCLANNLLSLGRGTEAELAYKRAIESRPDYFDAHHNLATLYADSLSDLSRASQSFENALAIRPQDVRCLTNYGVVLRRQGKIDEAIRAYERARALAPDDTRLLFALGNSYAMAQRLNEALSALDEATRNSPSNAKVLNSKGVVLEDLGRLNEAIAAFEAAVRADPGYEKARENLRRAKAANSVLRKPDEI